MEFSLSENYICKADMVRMKENRVGDTRAFYVSGKFQPHKTIAVGLFVFLTVTQDNCIEHICLLLPLLQ